MASVYPVALPTYAKYAAALAMPSSIISSAVADQESVPPPQNASIEGSAAVDAMAGQIDGSAKNSNKRKLGPRMDDPTKIESLFHKFDGTRHYIGSGRI